jgi:hypoxanthine phosphoribosyltransferase
VVQQFTQTSSQSQASRTRNARSRNNKSNRTVRNAPGPRFAHPAEADIAQWLTANGIRWQYEPTSFPLVIDDAGKLIQSFTPDFFLPDIGTYIEMTTMRQALVTRKNQKFRRMRELYPETNVRLLYRRDVELIQTWYGRKSSSSPAPDAAPRFSEAQINRRIRECADHLAATYPNSRINLIPLPGGERFAELVEAELPAVPHTRSRREQTVLVAGAVGTGATTYRAMQKIEAAESVQIITLVERPTARLVDLPIAFAGFQVGAEWLVGCGLGDADRSELFTVQPS